MTRSLISFKLKYSLGVALNLYTYSGENNEKTLLAALIMGITGARRAKSRSGLLCGLAVRECRKPYTVKDIPADKLTHVIYAFLSMCGPHTGASETVQNLG